MLLPTCVSSRTRFDQFGKITSSRTIRREQCPTLAKDYFDCAEYSTLVIVKCVYFEAKTAKDCFDWNVSEGRHAEMLYLESQLL